MRDALTQYELPRIPVGSWFEAVVDWLNDNIGPVFDFIDLVLRSAVGGLSQALTALPPPAMVLVFAALGWWLRSWRFGLFSLIGFGLVASVQEFESAMQTLSLVLVATAIAIAIGIPLGVLMARSGKVSAVLRPVLDLMQTMPAFVYLVPVIVFFNIGEVPGVVATVIFALPPGVRLTELGIRQVDAEVVEAGEAFGSPPRKILTGIQLPLAMPSIMAGVNQVIMLALSMVVIAGMVGAPGLGSNIYEAVTRVQLAQGFEAGLAVVILAVYLDRITAVLSDRSPVARAERKAARTG
ncbi:glycine betaine/proline transport system permease protein/glycine betaine/proline transport system substrate-binding protein [Saccharopolyspora antimicrobica]|uniref:Glycine betaine/proline transport system permease protein/glycine betaine/proline transport system substrate-binding protein n=1 Tax=Saccharopolyspora antimicrobica TaxID=455193 RepID=A0A1I5ED61_9PSEU|nr:proline/glycine betaine ABC transporter permease [Saccharopolyspora antimicrobica]RKT86765.1 glycine betaine/proline transport system permease protein/glycine betaine/proline transport system substrate-binding protein [Saccharopolyspora antimicrobica]SFO09226.1 glycine betaine/proline transport system permease protein/glycine betaine/proline transport system substrate-binding protein [Saccharopolyspora antimicrobica]